MFSHLPACKPNWLFFAKSKAVGICIHTRSPAKGMRRLVFFLLLTWHGGCWFWEVVFHRRSDVAFSSRLQLSLVCDTKYWGVYSSHKKWIAAVASNHFIRFTQQPHIVRRRKVTEKKQGTSGAADCMHWHGCEPKDKISMLINIVAQLGTFLAQYNIFSDFNSQKMNRYCRDYIIL